MLREATNRNRERLGSLPNAQQSTLSGPIDDFQTWMNDPEAQERMRLKREERERKEAARELANRETAWGTLIKHEVGIRYRDCRIENFTIDPASKHASDVEAAVSDLTAFCRDIESHVKDGDGLLMHGPVGAGKDHLLTGVLHAVVMAGFSVTFVNGMDLFAKLRDAIRDETTQRTILKPLISVDVLALSDPVPPKGDNSEFELEAMFSIVDRRYRQSKPTYITINVADRNEANARMAPQIVDRLAHNALSLHCNWPSYRKPLSRLRIADAQERTA